MSILCSLMLMSMLSSPSGATSSVDVIITVIMVINISISPKTKNSP